MYLDKSQHFCSEGSYSDTLIHIYSHLIPALSDSEDGLWLCSGRCSLLKIIVTSMLCGRIFKLKTVIVLMGRKKKHT